MMNALRDFFQRHGAIAMNKQRERLMKMPLPRLVALRSCTIRDLDDTCGPKHSDAQALLADLEAVIGFMRRGEEIRCAEERRKAEDEETTRRAEAFVADIRAKGISDTNALRHLRTIYCSDPKDCAVQAKVMAILHRAESSGLEV